MIMNEKEFNEWAEHVHLAEKLTEALEVHRVGRGYAAFNGLESGSVLVRITRAGNTFSFEKVETPLILLTPQEMENLGHPQELHDRMVGITPVVEEIPERDGDIRNLEKPDEKQLNGNYRFVPELNKGYKRERKKK